MRARTSGRQPVRRKDVRAGRAMLALAVLAVAVAMLIRPSGAPPLYDGLGFPDEYYRWVDPPEGAPRTPPVTSAVGTLSVQGDGTNTSALVKSNELGPQIQLYVSSGSFATPAGATSVTVRADAVHEPGPPPQGGVPAGNAYAIKAEADNGPVTLKLSILTQFRADKATDQRVVLHRWVDGKWEQVVTAPAGTDIYAGLIVPPATYALFKLPPDAKVTVEAPPPTPVPTWYTQTPAKADAWAAAEPASSRVSNRALWIGVGAAVVLLAAGLLLARIAARRRSGEERSDEDHADQGSADEDPVDEDPEDEERPDEAGPGPAE